MAQVKDIGKGSQGFVLLANDKFAGERVAIKCIPKTLAVSVFERQGELRPRGWNATKSCNRVFFPKTMWKVSGPRAARNFVLHTF